jgi:site-specific DNA recombinase
MSDNTIAIGYIRVSTGDQADNGVSLAAQRDRIEAYARMAGLQLVTIVEDAGVSGGTPLSARPGGMTIPALMHGHKAGHIIALKLDRLFRDAEDALGQTRQWDKAGVGLHLIDVGGQTINTGSAMGRMFLTMMAGFAELERGMISERTTAALAHKKRVGDVYSALPLGYANSDGKLVPIDEEMRVVAEIRDGRDAGMSFRAIADDLNARGITGKRGGRFYASTIKAICDNDLHDRLAA